MPSPKPSRSSTDVCIQAEPLSPPLNVDLDASLARLNSPAGKLRSAELLSKAVQIDTSAYDEQGPVTGRDADPRWAVFADFGRFLSTSFPTVYEKAEVEVVHEHALLYTVKGSKPKRKPVVLMAHQDVVPVDWATSSDWSFPPFSGAIEKGSVWGRGSCDCKSQLMGILTALESLLQAGFEPERTIILSFGYDEETTGFNGAGALAKELLGRYGKDGIEMVLDEGGEMETRDGRTWANVFVYYLPFPGAQSVLTRHVCSGEHGYMDVNVTIKSTSVCPSPLLAELDVCLSSRRTLVGPSAAHGHRHARLPHH